MRYYDISNLSFSQIRIFLCVMESESFTDAAKKLNFTQSMISKTIAALERDLGLILFIRQKNQNTPTPAARALYEEWKKLSARVEKSIEKAHAVQSGIQVELVIATADAGHFHSQLLSIFRRFSACHQEILLRYEEHSISGIMELAKSRAADVLITAAFDEDELRSCGYECRQLFSTELALFLHKTHPLAQKESINFSELQAEKFIVLSPASHPNYIPLLNSLGEAHGFKPRIAMQVPNAHSFIINLLTDRGIVLADTHTDIHHEDIKRMVISDLRGSYNGVIIAWRNESINALRFVDLACQICSDKSE